MGEKETSRRVVRIGVCIGIFMMDSMVSRPVVYIVLMGHGEKRRPRSTEEAVWPYMHGDSKVYESHT